MQVWIGVAILCVIMMFLTVLALYRLHTIDKIEKEHKKEIDELKNKTLIIDAECTCLRNFKEITENLVTGMRTDKEVREKIKELLFKPKQ